MVDPYKNLAWDDFRLIKAIGDVRSLPAAAALLGINHSTVFRRLAQIEEALGAKLFERHRSGYTLTTVGEEMVALAQRVDDDITAFTRKMAGRELAPAGELRVTTNDSLLIHLLTPLFVKFRKQCHDVRLDVVLANQELNLSKRDADVAIRATDNPPENLVGRRVASIAWALYGRADQFPDPGAVDPESLYERDWVSLGENLATLKAVKFVHEHVPPDRIGYRVNTVLGLAEAVEQGLGIGHLPCFIADRRPGLVRLGLPNPEFAADLWLLTHPDLRHSPRVRVFLDFLAAEVAKQRKFIEGTSAGPSVVDETAAADPAVTTSS
ncbi:LysR substrate-binding domain-containing protein [Microvirga tunisiensis]|uniref:LysR family transcriptional regulator n=1 Tax=Microvirga tunisiensis TaxID=2108360 RepID=A0A5N7MIV1_9HYPH|nr:LysR family transcriptional regulator [Microvirga tunisiensis]MPR26329.1 LysR family transcriptional regulator [Microvirga tunisiensis]